MKLERVDSRDIHYREGIDNIFDFPFMDSFTTVNIAIEEGRLLSTDVDPKSIANDDFYSIEEQKVYSQSELFEKFGIKKVENKNLGII